VVKTLEVTANTAYTTKSKSEHIFWHQSVDDATGDISETVMFLNLKLSILQAGIRQNRLAQVLDIDEAVLSKIINGFREPTSSQRKCIAEFLEKDERWLFEPYTIRRIEGKYDKESRPNLLR
jgi:ribosome-binding protein aMBF1 (putative translation factor)